MTSELYSAACLLSDSILVELCVCFQVLEADFLELILEAVFTCTSVALIPISLLENIRNLHQIQLFMH